MATPIVDDRARATRRAFENWTIELERYRHDAARVLDTHASRLGRCSVCAEAWPCQRVLAAEFVLEL